MGAVERWLIAVTGSLGCFGGCWAGLAAERVLDTGSQVGIASVPLVVVLTVLGAWAERARERKPNEKKLEADAQGERVSAEVKASRQGQAIGRVGDGTVVLGPGASMMNPVFHLGSQKDAGKEPLIEEGSGRGGVLVVGDVPQEPAAFQARPALIAALEPVGAARVSVVFAVTGSRGVGKTQVAAAYARQRMNDGWRLVAWVNASDEASLLAGLAQLAGAAGVGLAGEDARVLAAGVRHWLEADGDRRLLVLDNAGDLDGLRPFLPVAGTAQVVVTSSRQSAAGLGVPVPVDIFNAGEAAAFLAERTGLDDSAGARELAGELGFLPLGLAQAAALIAREHLSYDTYLGRLRALPVVAYLRRAEGDAYAYRLAEAIELSLRAVEVRDPSGACGRLMNLVAMLAETGIPRRLLHLATSTVISGNGGVSAVEIDAVVGDLADASLLGFTVDGESVVAHRLVMRVARERLAAEGTLPTVVDGAVWVLAAVAEGISEAWREPSGVRELAGQVSALVAHLASYRDALAKETLAGLLRLRLRSLSLLNELGDGTGLAIFAAEPLASDCMQLLGADHPDTLKSRSNLAEAYLAAGRTAEAIPLLARTLADRERLLGADHPDTLESRHDLSVAYLAAGRTAEAILLLDQATADFERLLGADHPDTLASRNNLALAYDASGRWAEAILLFEQTLANSERLLGADHPKTLTSRNNLAMTYQDAGQTAKAILFLEQTLADRERLLGADHPDTLASRNNLALVRVRAGRTAEAIPVLERTHADSERLLGADHPDTLQSRDNLAEAYLTARRRAKAIPLFERTLADRERLLGADHPRTLASRGNLAGAYLNAGRKAEAIPLFERTLADRERLLGADHPDTLASRNNLARAYLDAGRKAEAIPLFERTLADCERLLGADHRDTNVVRKNLIGLTGKRKRLKRR
jgi:hypothetical protein